MSEEGKDLTVLFQKRLSPGYAVVKKGRDGSLKKGRINIL